MTYTLDSKDIILQSTSPFPILVRYSDQTAYSVNILRNNRVEIRYALRNENEMSYCGITQEDIENALDHMG